MNAVDCFENDDPASSLSVTTQNLRRLLCTAV